MKAIEYFIAIMLLSSCGQGYEINELYTQKIEDSDKSIFHYDAWSTLNDGNKYGATILGLDESIAIQKAERLPLEFLFHMPTSDTIYSIQLDDGGTRTPEYKSTSITQFKGIFIKTDHYSYQYGASTNLAYNFSDFRETKDSLFLFGISRVYFDLPTKKNELAFEKGNVKLVESDSNPGVIDKIEIRAFLLPKFGNGSIDYLTIIRDVNFYQFDGLVHFEFKPLRPINTNAFTDFGIYKKRAITDVKRVQ